MAVARFFQPTTQQVAVRDELASISRLDELDATHMIVGRVKDVNKMLAAGRTPKDIAVHIHLRYVIGATAEDEAALRENIDPESFMKNVMKVTGYVPYTIASDGIVYCVGDRVYDVIDRCNGEIVGIAADRVVKVKDDTDGETFEVTINYLNLV